ncbi:uncharacterized protein LOC110182694 [Drosophila serrata]|uniref:uncharacterized protein LOC110182694 n=1 Tax=Drosophila serrata TaxID=7274 RepID=UPI000A1D173B|nr:uncharacterized protein LOC110182694 [Drosophila serrata]XP_020806448.1 uncharacterized protein LOC110182694 [Drosophila serrata]
MEHIFSFPVPRMSIGMIHMECPIPNRTQPAVEYSPLNPNAMEFVPSHRQTPEISSINIKTKSEATTSTTTLARPEIVGDAVNQVENGYSVHRQIFECLSQLGDEQMPLEEVAVTLLPGGRGLNMRFTTKQKPGQLFQLPDPNETIIHRGQTLRLEVGDPKKLDNRPESVLVAQFLFRVNDLLREKYEDGGDVSICPKCTLCSNRSYTELEIEHQIEGIKAFENFTFTESTRYQDLVSHKAFKELCRKLGLIVSRDQIHINRACSGQSPAVSPPPPSAEASVATISIQQTINEMETDVEAYAGDDEAQSNGHDQTPKVQSNYSVTPETPTEYVRGKLYRYENSEGSQLVNQLSELGAQSSELMTVDDNDESSTPTNPIIAPSKPTTFPRVYKSAKARCSVRGGGTSLQNGAQARRATPYSRTPAQMPQSTLTTIQRCRLPSGGGQFQGTSATDSCSKARKLHTESCLPAPTRKQNYQRAIAPKSELGCQQAGTMKASMAGRQPRQGRQPANVSKPQLNHLCKGAAQGPNPKQQHGNALRMIPRSTTTSLMRQSEVKRRMSLLRGESDSDMLFNEYLFK